MRKRESSSMTVRIGSGTNRQVAARARQTTPRSDGSLKSMLRSRMTPSKAFIVVIVFAAIAYGIYAMGSAVHNQARMDSVSERYQTRLQQVGPPPVDE